MCASRSQERPGRFSSISRKRSLNCWPVRLCGLRLHLTNQSIDVPDIIELANQFRSAVLRNEREAALRLIEAYDGIYSRLSRELAELNQQIADARAKGEIINQSWLFRQQRYGDLLRQVDAELKRFAD